MKILSIYQFILAFLCFFSTTANAIPSLFTDFAGEIVSTYHKFHNISWPEFDFWNSTADLGNRLKHIAEDELREKVDQYGVGVEKIKEFKEAMGSVVDSVEALQIYITTQQGLNLEDFKAKFLAHIEPVLEDFKAEFAMPLPEDQTERYKQRSMIIGRVLDKIEDAFVLVSGSCGIPEDGAREKFGQFKSLWRRVLDMIAKLLDDHPGLFKAIMWTVATLIVPDSELWLLRLLLVEMSPRAVVSPSCKCRNEMDEVMNPPFQSTHLPSL